MVEELIRQFGLLDRPGIPTFEEFVHSWLPAEYLQLARGLDGGRQGSTSTAMLEMMYPVFVAMKVDYPWFKVKGDMIAALRDTETPKLPMELLKSPFEGFGVVVPHGTFQEPAQEVTEVFVSNVQHDRFRVVFSHGEHSHYISILTDNPEELISESMARTLGRESMLPAYLREEIQEDSMYENYYKTDIFRFALNLALYITCPDADMKKDDAERQKLLEKLKRVKGPRRRRSIEDRIRKAKQKNVYIVGANVRLQQEYKAELTESGKKWVLKHRVRVMGHWKQQAYGPERKLRKTKWIEPYWRGPSYAEMLEKEYIIK